MRNLFSPLITIGLVLVLVVGGVLIFKSFMNPGFFVNRDRTAVITQIKQLNRLETSVFTIEKVIDAGTSGNEFQNFLFGDKILLIAHGKVVAGVDLSKMNDTDINITNDSVSLKLPATEIFNSDLDETKTEVYDRTQGILTKGNKDLESVARQAAEEEIRRAACEGGILSEAADSAKQQLHTLLQALNFTTIEIQTEVGNCSVAT